MKRLFCTALTALLLICGCATAKTLDTLTEQDRQDIFSYQAGKLDGLNFTPYMDGQSAETTVHLDAGQIRERLTQVVPYTDGIRTYGSANGLEQIPKIANELGLTCATGLYISEDDTANRKQLENAIANAQYSSMLVVGNECLNLDIASAQTLASMLKEARSQLDAAGYENVLITTNDTYLSWYHNPEILELCDVLMLSYHPYFGESDPLVAATEHLPSMLAKTFELAGNKPVILGEIGWPSYDEEASGDSEAGRKLAALYDMIAIRTAREYQMPMFLFSSHDEAWKIRVEGKHAGTWGLLDSDGVLKYPQLFEGSDSEIHPLVLSSEHKPLVTEIPEEATGPKIHITHWPDNELPRVTGTITGIEDLDEAPYMMVFIRVDGLWWVKPTYEAVTQPLVPDGNEWTFSISTRSHPNDVHADNFIVLLLPADHPAHADSMETNLIAALDSVTLLP